MEVTITTRHCSVPETTLQRTHERLDRLTRFEPRAAHVHVIFSSDGSARQAETLVTIHGGGSLVARAHGESFRSALEQAIDRLERQLRRRRARRRQHRAGLRDVQPTPTL